MSTVINLTPHDVTVYGPEGTDQDPVIFPASGDVARLATVDFGTSDYDLNGESVPVALVEFAHLRNPPPMIKGTEYLVSLPCALAFPRGDFLVPYQEVRDDQGRILGCRLLARAV